MLQFSCMEFTFLADVDRELYRTLWYMRCGALSICAQPLDNFKKKITATFNSAVLLGRKCVPKNGGGAKGPFLMLFLLIHKPRVVFLSWIWCHLKPGSPPCMSFTNIQNHC